MRHGETIVTSTSVHSKELATKKWEFHYWTSEKEGVLVSCAILCNDDDHSNVYSCNTYSACTHTREQSLYGKW